MNILSFLYVLYYTNRLFYLTGLPWKIIKDSEAMQVIGKPSVARYTLDSLYIESIMCIYFRLHDINLIVYLWRVSCALISVCTIHTLKSIIEGIMCTHFRLHDINLIVYL